MQTASVFEFGAARAHESNVCAAAIMSHPSGEQTLTASATLLLQSYSMADEHCGVLIPKYHVLNVVDSNYIFLLDGKHTLYSTE